MSDAFKCEFYIDTLLNDIFPFWGKNCFDDERGGFFTCFSNDGKTLVSTDKFTWSQGRMIWVLSELFKSGLMPEKSDMLLKRASDGADFLMKNCLDDTGECVFIMRRDGEKVIGEKSIYADCFAVLGLANFASVSGRTDALCFSEKLFESIWQRYTGGCYETAPYPVPRGLSAHGVPMILTNTARTLADAETSLGKNGDLHYSRAYETACIVCDDFIGDDGILREFIGQKDLLLTSYINPGHTIEDVWFMLDEFERTGDSRRTQKVLTAAKNALTLGWDSEFGGLLLFASDKGGEPHGEDGAFALEPMTKKVRSDWNGKLWWVHSEALYSAIRCFKKTGDLFFRDFAEKIFDYTFSTFPDRENSEWIQIRARDGSPENKIVALPVKDPFHIQRNLLKIIKILE